MLEKKNWKGNFIRFSSLKLLLGDKKKIYLKNSNLMLFPIFLNSSSDFFLYSGRRYQRIILDKKRIFMKLNLFLISRKIGFSIHRKNKNKKNKKR